MRRRRPRRWLGACDMIRCGIDGRVHLWDKKAQRWCNLSSMSLQCPLSPVETTTDPSILPPPFPNTGAFSLSATRLATSPPPRVTKHNNRRQRRARERRRKRAPPSPPASPGGSPPWSGRCSVSSASRSCGRASSNLPCPWCNSRPRSSSHASYACWRPAVRCSGC